MTNNNMNYFEKLAQEHCTTGEKGAYLFGLTDIKRLCIAYQAHDAEKMEQQRDELLEALKDCIKQLPAIVHLLADKNISDEVKNSVEFQTFYKARNAIAKAEAAKIAV